MADESSFLPPERPRDVSAGALRIAQEAAEWVVRRDRGLHAAEVPAFDRWRNADPRHEQELARINRTWSGLDQASASSELNVLAEAVVLRARAQRRRRRARWATGLSLAAAAALVIGIFRVSAPEAAPLAVPVLENVRVLESTLAAQTLEDGSVVQLNGNSRIVVAFTGEQRSVRLESGEAHFLVAKDAARPFVVTAGTLAVRAVGTAFNVRLAPESVEVLVTEGTVKVASGGQDPNATGAAAMALSGGQRVVVPHGPDTGNLAVAQVSATEMSDYLAWQATRLVFDNTPLAGVVEAFNRYEGPKLVVGDPALANRPLTGTFRADNVEGFVRLLRASADVRSERRPDGAFVLLPAN